MHAPGSVFKIVLKGQIKTVTADHVKPAHIESEPEPGITQKRRMQPNSLPTVNRPAAIARTARSRSMITAQPLKTGVKWGRTTNSQSLTLGVGLGPAIAPRSNTTGARLPNSPTPYRAPHVRTSITSRANLRKRC